jgi:hypothetical protein
MQEANDGSDWLPQLLGSSVSWRVSAANALGGRKALRPDVLAALVRALQDEEYYEHPGDYDAPTFIYSVAAAAATALQQRVDLALPLLAEQLQGCSAHTAVYTARVLAHGGANVVELVLDLLLHPAPQVRKEAVLAIAQLRNSVHDDRLMLGLMHAMLESDGELAYAAVSSVGYAFRDRPELVDLARPELLEALIAQARAEPQSGTRVDAVAHFVPRTLDGLVELAAAGSAHAAQRLRSHVRRLSEESLLLLARGRITDATVATLGQAAEELALSEATRAAIAAQIPLETRPGVLALLRLRSCLDRVLPVLPKLYVEAEDTQAIILRAHPNLDAFADEVLPLLRQPAQANSYVAMQGLKRLGPLACRELSWIVPLLQPYRDDLHLRQLLDVVGAMGADAEPAFPALAALLDHPRHQPWVLETIAQIGAPAGPHFLELLQVLKAEQKPYARDKEPLDRALRALG